MIQNTFSKLTTPNADTYVNLDNVRYVTTNADRTTVFIYFTGQPDHLTLNSDAAAQFLADFASALAAS